MDQKALKGFHQTHFQARRIGDTQQGLAAQRAIESFKQSGQQASKRIRESMTTPATLVSTTLALHGFQTLAPQDQFDELKQMSNQVRQASISQSNECTELSSQGSIGTLMATGIDHGVVNSRQTLADKSFAVQDLWSPSQVDKPKLAPSSTDARSLQTRRSRDTGAVLPFMLLDFSNLDHLGQSPRHFLRNMKS